MADERWDTRWARQVQRSDVGLGAKRTASLLATFMDATGKCWPSQATLARAAQVSDRQIRYDVRELADAGWLLIKQRGNRQTPMYRAAFGGDREKQGGSRVEVQGGSVASGITGGRPPSRIKTCPELGCEERLTPALDAHGKRTGQLECFTHGVVKG